MGLNFKNEKKGGLGVQLCRSEIKFIIGATKSIGFKDTSTCTSAGQCCHDALGNTGHCCATQGTKTSYSCILIGNINCSVAEHYKC
ncbi:MAG: hypothetical protein QM528_04590 [Phycisphaerales bacterium]|nr:hypothetical protein [Phycisphaerales bacterium]